jgi:hypothetical protein
MECDLQYEIKHQTLNDVILHPFHKKLTHGQNALKAFTIVEMTNVVYSISMQTHHHKGILVITLISPQQH